jgi:hypothetical protein
VVASDLTINPADVFTTLLGPLAGNGGPTPTHALLAGGLAIDAGDPVNGCEDQFAAPLTEDQRGFSRPFGSECDIGAFEARCGDGILDAGESCDDGAANGTLTSCCTGSCEFEPLATACDDSNAGRGAGDATPSRRQKFPVSELREIGRISAGRRGRTSDRLTPMARRTRIDIPTLTSLPTRRAPSSDRDDRHHHDRGGRESHERVTSPIDYDGRLFVAANHWPRAWYDRA